MSTRINLLPDHVLARRRRTQMFMRVGIAAVFATIAAAAWGAIARSQLNELSGQFARSLTKLSNEQQRSRAIEMRAAEARSLRAMLAHRGQLEPPVASAGVLTLLTHLLPDSVALTRLTMDVPPPDLTFRGQPPATPAVGAGATLAATAAPAPLTQLPPTRVVLEGLALSDVELTQVVSALAAQKAFTNVKLVRSRQVPLDGAARFGFEISLEIPPTRAAPVKPGSPPAAAAARSGERGQRGA